MSTALDSLIDTLNPDLKINTDTVFVTQGTYQKISFVENPSSFLIENTIQPSTGNDSVMLFDISTLDSSGNTKSLSINCNTSTVYTNDTISIDYNDSVGKVNLFSIKNGVASSSFSNMQSNSINTKSISSDTCSFKSISLPVSPNSITFIPPSDLTSSYTLTLPASIGVDGVLGINTDGTMFINTSLGGAITLTGAVTGSSNTGTIATTMSTTGVTANTYYNPYFTVGLDGRITSATDRTISLTGSVTGTIDNTTGAIATTLASTQSITTLTATTVNATNVSAFTAQGNINMNSKKITSLATPTATTDAATKAYVDSIDSSATAVTAYNASYYIGQSSTNPRSASGYPKTYVYAPMIFKTTNSFFNTSATNGSFSYYAYNVQGNASGAYDYDIVCNYRIQGKEFNAVSSKKKKNVLESDRQIVQQEALSIFNSIDFFKYDFKDKVLDGSYTYYGVIAEELAILNPQFVSDANKQYVPNIMKMCDANKLSSEVIYEDNVTYYVTTFDLVLDEAFTETLESDQLQVITDTISGVCTILNISDDKTVLRVTHKTQDELDYPTRAFVYGTYESCPSVSKQNIFEIGMVAIQSLIDKNASLESRITDLETRLSTLLINK